MEPAFDWVHGASASISHTMMDRVRYEYDGPVLHFGDSCVDDLHAAIRHTGAQRALIVCGRSVGANPAVIEPIRDGLGDTFGGLFAETTPDKRLATAVAASHRLTDEQADVIVAVGGGSSLDVAKTASALGSGDLNQPELTQTFGEQGTIPVSENPIPLIVIPTTLAGADLSFGAGITADPATDPIDEPVSGGVSDPALMPAAAFYDPSIVANTPMDVLAGSAMNGFDKGIETLYAPSATPITDATAARGLRLLRRGLPELIASEGDTDTISTILEGTVLVQYGIARPDARKLSIIHALGHGVKATVDVQQGLVHAIMVPHVLRFIFDRVEGRRRFLGDALGVDTHLGDDALADEIISTVELIRDRLRLPSRLHEIPGLTRDHLDLIAKRTADDSLMANQPRGIDMDETALLKLLERAW